MKYVYFINYEYKKQYFHSEKYEGSDIISFDEQIVGFGGIREELDKIYKDDRNNFHFKNIVFLHSYKTIQNKVYL